MPGQSVWSLPEPIPYFPPGSGRYEVSAGLRPLGTPAGGDYRDRLVFQFDSEFSRYRLAKLAARRECPGKYVARLPDQTDVCSAIALECAEIAAREWPHLFERTGTTCGVRLDCRLTGERLAFTHTGHLLTQHTIASADPPYASSLDAVACQLQEDLAILTHSEQSGSAVCGLHVCLPSDWEPRSKLGLSFNETHRPVPHFERLARASETLSNALTYRVPQVRFGWGLTSDDMLNRHPDRPVRPGYRSWDVALAGSEPREAFYLRVERQALVGFPTWNATLFTIRVGLLPGSCILADSAKSERLARAVRSMSPESIAYKGLEQAREPLLAMLERAARHEQDGT